MPPTPDHPDAPETPATETIGRADLDRAVRRQRSGRRRVAVAVAALAVGLVSAACSSANAATPGVERTGISASQAGGHAGHGGAPSVETPDDGDPAAEADGQTAEGAPEEGAPEANPAEEGAADQGAADNGAAVKDAKAAEKDAKAAGKDAKAAGKDAKAAAKGGAQRTNGLDVLGQDCSKSKLPEHTGFQDAPACVDTAFGEVAAGDKSPALLITDAPDTVKAGDSFTLKVSTRNLVRDRFLGAAAGGYYLESSFLDDEGIQRGHFHTACRMLPSLDEAPDSAPAPAFFVATQDNKGGSGTDTVDVVVTGLPEKGTAQCTSWAGDGSHRIPMMQRANQTPAVDSVRVTVE